MALGWRHRFAQWRLHRPLAALVRAARRLERVAAYSAWREAEARAPFDDFPCAEPRYTRRSELYAHLLEQRQLADGPIDYLEFGVAGGDSLRWWLAHQRHPDSRFYGFDGFTGLPEAWEEKAAGHFGREGRAPLGLDDPRCTLVPGLFQQTLLPFLAETKLPHRRVVHLDADLYSATLYVLLHLEPVLSRGDLVLLDEFTSLEHELRAWQDALAATHRRARLVGARNNYRQVAFELES
jgi:hypothetical protein